MFDKLGQFASLMKNLPKMQEEMGSLSAARRKHHAQITAEGDAGGGMVKAKVNGHMEVTACVISDEAMKDKELLEDLVRAAVNQAIQKAKHAVAEETSKMASGLGLPPGFQLPVFDAHPKLREARNSGTAKSNTCGIWKMPKRPGV